MSLLLSGHQCDLQCSPGTSEGKVTQIESKLTPSTTAARKNPNAQQVPQENQTMEIFYTSAGADVVSPHCSVLKTEHLIYWRCGFFVVSHILS